MICRLRHLLLPLLSFAGASSLQAAALINEIMYNPDGNENATEYVELYNPDAGPVDLSGCRISDGSADDLLIPWPGDGSMLLGPEQYAIILDSGYWEFGEGWYDNRIPEGTLLLTTADAALGSYGLSNSTAETVSLIAPDQTIVSSRQYRLESGNGISEERILFDQGEHDSNWAFSHPGGTPGYRNSASPFPYDLALDSLSLAPVPFTDGKGNGTLRLLAVLANVGLESSQQTRFQLTLDRHLDTGYRNQFSWEVPALVPEESFIIRDSLLSVPPGRYRAETELVDHDDNPANTSTEEYFRFPYSFGSMLVQELMPDPPASAPVEWMELWNMTSEAIPLGGWSWMDASGHSVFVDSTASWVPAYGVAVLAEDDLASVWEDGIESGVYMPETWPSLNNGGDTLAIFDPSGEQVDSVFYPPCISGLSIYREDSLATFEEVNWGVMPDSLRGTPGNKGVPEREDPAAPSASSFSCRFNPNPFRPGSGTTFEYESPATTLRITVSLFSSGGHPLATLLDDAVLPGSGSWHWDGRKGLGRNLPLGLYVYHVRAVNPETGVKWEHKGALASAGSSR